MAYFEKILKIKRGKITVISVTLSLQSASSPRCCQSRRPHRANSPDTAPQRKALKLWKPSRRDGHRLNVQPGFSCSTWGNHLDGGDPQSTQSFKRTHPTYAPRITGSYALTTANIQKRACFQTVCVLVFLCAHACVHTMVLV